MPRTQVTPGKEPIETGRNSSRFDVAGDEVVISSYLAETDAYEDGRTALYAQRTRDAGTPNPGAGYALAETNTAITGYNYWGDDYSFGIAGYCYNDNTKTAGVLGAQWNADYWGALGYKDAHYFSRAFKKTVGKPPSAFRSKSKKVHPVRKPVHLPPSRNRR